MHGGTGPEKAWSWLISLIALGLFIWGVAELLGLSDHEPVVSTSVGVAAELSTLRRGEMPTELHNLLPDATDDIGRLVSVDGMVVGDTSPAGFWVRDFRDYIIFVQGEQALHLEAGDAVRVVGRIVLLTAEERADRLERAGLVVPASAIVIRDVKVLPTADGIELLDD